MKPIAVQYYSYTEHFLSPILEVHNFISQVTFDLQDIHFRQIKEEGQNIASPSFLKTQLRFRLRIAKNRCFGIGIPLHDKYFLIIYFLMYQIQRQQKSNCKIIFNQSQKLVNAVLDDFQIVDVESLGYKHISFPFVLLLWGSVAAVIICTIEALPFYCLKLYARARYLYCLVR